MGLNPMKAEMGPECDNCGACISSCNDDALAYRVGFRSISHDDPNVDVVDAKEAA